MRFERSCFCSLLAIAILGFNVAAAESEKAKPTKINVNPADVSLKTARDRQSVIVQAVYPNGITRDVTAQAKLTLTNGSLIRLEKNVLYPAADGKTELKVEFGGHTVTVPVEVAEAKAERPISFKLDVMPVFMKAGCNTGSCHGAASGKDGFRLSLFGYDPDGDHYRITRELPGRRINLAVPERSLMLEKTGGRVPHTGGKRFSEDSELYQTLLRWHKAGAPADKGAVPKVVSVELYPKESVLDGENVTQQLSVRAQYEDGTSRDITSLAYFLSGNGNSAEVDQTGLVTAGARGEAFVMARFSTYTVGVPFIVLPKGLTFEDPKTPENNYVDTFIHKKLNKLRINPSGLCSDEEFLRRAYIDIAGVLPTIKEYNRFLRPEESWKAALAAATEAKATAEKLVVETAKAAQQADAAVPPAAKIAADAQKPAADAVKAQTDAATKLAAAQAALKNAKDDAAKKAAEAAVKQATEAKQAADKLVAQTAKAVTDAEAKAKAATDAAAAAKLAAEQAKQAVQTAIKDIATSQETIKTANNNDPKKREKLVDELLNRKEFVELWVMKWAELLQIRTVANRVAYKPMLRYYNWLQERIANNVTMDVMVQELLGANGGTFANAATNYYQAETNTLKVAENVAQVFMGMRIQCTQCHNHPFDRWTMDDYYAFANFFSQIGRKRGEDPRETIVFNSGSGAVRHPVGNRIMPPKFLGGEIPDVKGKDRRVVMAKWLASPQNPYFAKNLANIVWAHFMGRGIIHEVDDVRVSNPPVNGELLDELGKRFTDYNYDFKKLVRDICTSRTYQLSTKTNETNESDGTNFSHASLRRMRAEIMYDAVTQVTATKNKFPGLPLGARAVQIANGNTSTYFLTTFGRAKRGSVCSCEVKMEPNLSQALHMINGDTANNKIKQGGLIDRWLKEKKSPEQIIEDLYVMCFSRKPIDAEKKNLYEFVNAEADKKTVLEDVFWSLLNSREFLFNH